MSRVQAEQKATFFNAFVKHPNLSYKPVKLKQQDKYAVGQFLNETQVGIF